jgi:predicted membrane-bound spermidine synthase
VYSAVASEPERRDTQLAVWVPLFAAALLTAAHEIGARQTDAYLGPSLSTPRSVALALMSVGIAAGFIAGRSRLRSTASRSQLLTRLGGALAFTCAASGGLWFCSFEVPSALPLVACGLPGAVGLLAGACAGALLHAVARPYRELQAMRLLLAPVPLVAGLLLTLAGCTALSYLGVWRAAALLGAVLAALTLFVPRFADYLADVKVGSRRPAVVALAAAGVSLAAAQAFVPASLLARYPTEVVWARDETVIISAQNTFELFEAQQLRLSSVDDYRLAELAVHPLLSALPSARRLLLLGPAGGFLEREALRYPQLVELVSLSETDGAKFRASLWGQRAGSKADSRLRFEVAEPIPWLEQRRQPFDAVIVALPAPSGPSTGKYYTKYFYELVRERLTPGGGLAVQAPSRHVAPATFASIRETLRRAGLVEETYDAPVPLLGSLSFLLAARGSAPVPEATALPPELRYLDPPALRRAQAAVPTPSAGGSLSTLDHLRIVEVWHREQAAVGN